MQSGAVQEGGGVALPELKLSVGMCPQTFDTVYVVTVVVVFRSSMCRLGRIVVVVRAAPQCSVLLSSRRSLAVSCHSRAPVAVVDASPHPDHAVHAGIVRCCHLHAACAAETADDLD